VAASRAAYRRLPQKYRDANSVVFDVIDEEHAKTVWRIPT
jgi:hypothetical protein